MEREIIHQITLRSEESIFLEKALSLSLQQEKKSEQIIEACGKAEREREVSFRSTKVDSSLLSRERRMRIT